MRRDCCYALFRHTTNSDKTMQIQFSINIFQHLSFPFLNTCFWKQKRLIKFLIFWKIFRLTFWHTRFISRANKTIQFQYSILIFDSNIRFQFEVNIWSKFSINFCCHEQYFESKQDTSIPIFHSNFDTNISNSISNYRNTDFWKCCCENETWIFPAE